MYIHIFYNKNYNYYYSLIITSQNLGFHDSNIKQKNNAIFGIVAAHNLKIE